MSPNPREEAARLDREASARCRAGKNDPRDIAGAMRHTARELGIPGLDSSILADCGVNASMGKSVAYGKLRAALGDTAITAACAEGGDVAARTVLLRATSHAFGLGRIGTARPSAPKPAKPKPGEPAQVSPEEPAEEEAIPCDACNHDAAEHLRGKWQCGHQGCDCAQFVGEHEPADAPAKKNPEDAKRAAERERVISSVMASTGQPRSRVAASYDAMRAQDADAPKPGPKAARAVPVNSQHGGPVASPRRGAPPGVDSAAWERSRKALFGGPSR